jgi:hypothetical protein
MKHRIKKEVDVLIKALENDPAYYYTWQANIAMAVKDEWLRMVDNVEMPSTYEHIHDLSNRAAKNFLNLLINQGN